MDKKPVGFLGTYFNKDVLLRLSLASKILAWVVLAYHLFQLVFSVGVNILQILRGYWTGMGITDVLQAFLNILAQPLHGVVYFFALLGISQLLLVFMDIEENTRRAARNSEQKQ